MNRSWNTEGWSVFLCVEAMAQLGGIASATEEGGGGILAAIDQARFHALPEPGERLTVSVQVVKAFGPLALVEGEVGAGEKVVATATMTLRVGRLA